MKFTSERKASGAYAINMIDPNNEVFVVGNGKEWFLLNCNQERIRSFNYAFNSKANAIQAAHRFLKAKSEWVIKKIQEPSVSEQITFSMNYETALNILGFTPSQKPDKDQIKNRYKHLLQTLHPDLGGSEYLTKQVNLAKDYLLQ